MSREGETNIAPEKEEKVKKERTDLIKKRKKRQPESPRIKTDPIADLLCSVAISHFRLRKWMHPSQYEEMPRPIFSASVFPLHAFSRITLEMNNRKGKRELTRKYK